jgi:hypothetical protein
MNIQSFITVSFFVSIFIQIYIPIWLEVFSNHGSRLNNSGLLGKLCSCEGLSGSVFGSTPSYTRRTYSSIRGISNGLTNQLVGPFLSLGVVPTGVDTWHNERHIEIWVREICVVEC